jgi:hypothetical protein
MMEITLGRRKPRWQRQPPLITALHSNSFLLWPNALCSAPSAPITGISMLSQAVPTYPSSARQPIGRTGFRIGLRSCREWGELGGGEGPRCARTEASSRAFEPPPRGLEPGSLWICPWASPSNSRAHGPVDHPVRLARRPGVVTLPTQTSAVRRPPPASALYLSVRAAYLSAPSEAGYTARQGSLGHPASPRCAGRLRQPPLRE